MNTTIGKNWLLMRGLARESGHWDDDFITLLQSTFPNAQITLLDLPGSGRFHCENSPSTLSEIMDKARHYALAQGFLKQPITLLALSLGAMVAWEWMLKYPDDINAAALVSTSFAGLNPWYQRLRWQSYGKFAALLTKNNSYDREMAILRLVSNRPDQYGQVAEQWQKIQQRQPMSNINIYQQLLAAVKYRPPPWPPRQPVLLLNGKGDRLVSPQCSEAIHNQWHLELRTHPWAGHDLPLDDGSWLVDQLNEWVDQIRNPIISF